MDEVPTVSWGSAAARQVQVYRCVTGCPAAEELPGYPDALTALEDQVLVWDLMGISGVESGEGTLPSPLVYGEVPEDVSAEELKEADELVAGDYRVLVIQGEGNFFRAEFGTGWAGFELDE